MNDRIKNEITVEVFAEPREPKLSPSTNEPGNSDAFKHSPRNEQFHIQATPQIEVKQINQRAALDKYRKYVEPTKNQIKISMNMLLNKNLKIFNVPERSHINESTVLKPHGFPKPDSKESGTIVLDKSQFKPEISYSRKDASADRSSPRV